MLRVPLAIMAALDDEIRTIASRISVDSRVHVRPALFTRGMYGKMQILLGRSGIGREAMDLAIRYCLDGFRPAMCLHVGYCGGADPALAAGDLVVASTVVDARTGQRMNADPALIETARVLIEKRGLRGRTGIVATVDEIAPSPHEKAFVGTNFDAVAMDMESASLAAACENGHVPYLVVRAVLDPLSEVLPDLGDAIDGTGHTDFFSLAEHLIRHPQHALKLPHLEYLASQARRSITAFVDAWITEAPR